MLLDEARLVDKLGLAHFLHTPPPRVLWLDDLIKRLEESGGRLHLVRVVLAEVATFVERHQTHVDILVIADQIDHQPDLVDHLGHVLVQLHHGLPAMLAVQNDRLETTLLDIDLWILHGQLYIALINRQSQRHALTHMSHLDDLHLHGLDPLWVNIAIDRMLLEEVDESIVAFDETLSAVAGQDASPQKVCREVQLLNRHGCASQSAGDVVDVDGSGSSSSGHCAVAVAVLQSKILKLISNF